jgi:hypothetical protein
VGRGLAEQPCLPHDASYMPYSPAASGIQFRGVATPLEVFDPLRIFALVMASLRAPKSGVARQL